MKFYKIFRQMETKNKKEFFYSLLEIIKYEYIIGNYSNSFAIKYDPETFNKLLDSNATFKEYNKRSVQQLFVTNQKFLILLNYIDSFDMEIQSCVFVEDENDEYLHEYDELCPKVIEDVVQNYSFNIKEITLLTVKSKRKIILQKNGVIGIDNGLTILENQKVLKLIDTLNFGLKVIDK